MSRLTLKQIQGLQQLIQDGVEAGANATEEVHQAIASQVYAVLGHIPGIARPAGLVERVQHTLTRGVYRTVRAVNLTVGQVAARALEQFDEQPVREPGGASPRGLP
ncbi:MAG: hypothetical protein H6970_08910 [Gammaproteobacteria bacterium]|nr:hypothetical protein [Gammaproteobacteria bacterium]